MQKDKICIRDLVSIRSKKSIKERLRIYVTSISPFSSLIGLIVSNIVLSLIIVLGFFSQAFMDFKTFIWAFIWAFAICITQWVGHGYINIWLNSRYKWIQTPVKRTILGIVLLVGYAVFAFVGVQIIMYYFYYGKFPDQMWTWILQSAYYPALISFGVSLLFTTFGFFHAWKESVVNGERLKTEMMTYKYESLRNQINPHFLFNSFNVLSELIYDDQKTAVRFVQQMSDLFRYVLDSRDKELVPLSEEIEFIESFSYLLKTRFEDKLTIEIDVETNKDDLIVPISLQLLIENAVKHNEVSEAFPLNINIKKQNGYINVRNTLQIKNVGDDSKETGLKNIKQQFSFFTDTPIDIRKTENEFIVRLPVLKSVEE